MSNFTAGLDLGQARDFTALVITERLEALKEGYGNVPTPDLVSSAYQDRYHVRSILRYPLRTPYPEIVRKVADVLQHPEYAGRTKLVLDYTGVGRPIADLFYKAYRESGLLDYPPIAFTFTASEKRNLVAKLGIILDENRLEIAEGLRLSQDLVEELKDFRAKISDSGHDSYEAAKKHDDLVTALMLSVSQRWRLTPWAIPRFQMRDGTAVEYEDLLSPKSRERVRTYSPHELAS